MNWRTQTIKEVLLDSASSRKEVRQVSVNPRFDYDGDQYCLPYKTVAENMDVVLRHHINSICVFENGNISIIIEDIKLYKKIAEDDRDYNISAYKNYKHYKGDWYTYK